MLASSSIPLVKHSRHLTNWLHDYALPLWLERGFEESGGFSESLTLDGQGTSADRRSRIYPRQIYCYAEAGARGWLGGWERPVRSGMAQFERVYRLESGFYGAIAAVDGRLIDDSFDLYNQAFAILAFCYTAKALPDTAVMMSDRAHSLLNALKTQYAHPKAGFYATASLPLCSNPHMHLFEAALACEEQLGFDPATWAGLADQLAELCISRFVDAETGVLREFFDGDWRPAEGIPGRIVEPGHQFEWAWLLARWGERRKRTDALSAAKRLFQIGENNGICQDRNVAVMALLDDFSVHDPMARLWPQTEWLKAAMRLAVMSNGEERQRYLASARRAARALDLFLDTSIVGLWRDKLLQDGSFIEEAAPTSSFYHVLCAIYELQDCLRELSMQSPPLRL
jgi:mannose-6-phosphate isomerase